MFKLLLHLTRALLPISVIVVWGGIALLTRYAPPPLALAEPRAEPFGFTTCALPCYAGLTVGVTHMTDAMPHIIANIPVLDRRLLAVIHTISFWGSLEDGDAISGSVDFAANRVRAIRVSVALRGAWLIDVLGAPTCVYPRDERASDSVTLLIWERADATISATLRQSLTLVNLHADQTLNLAISTETDYCTRVRALAWRGFEYLWSAQRRTTRFAE